LVRQLGQDQDLGVLQADAASDFAEAVGDGLGAELDMVLAGLRMRGLPGLQVLEVETVLSSG